MDRRTFLINSAAAAVGAAGVNGLAQAASPRLPIRKAVEFAMLPKELSPVARLRLAKECGFEAVEIGTQPDPRLAEEYKRASDDAGLPIHSVMNMGHWQYPLTSPDPEVVARCLKGMETSLDNAKLWGAQTVLLVPGVVTPQVTYQQAWERSQREIRKLIPLAEQHKVIIGIEEVWNKFLLSPLEMAHYIDEFHSPWIRAYFDVGNVVLYGYPQDWIRTLGPRIIKLHIKDFTARRNKQIDKTVLDWVNLRDGDIDWKAIYQALKEIGYKGVATTELEGGDAAYLKDVNRRFDAILEGA
ncbi:MAG: sugar phosphate isomerase/epimerase family protein [Bryobacteraceae bacterium]